MTRGPGGYSIDNLTGCGRVAGVIFAGLLTVGMIFYVAMSGGLTQLFGGGGQGDEGPGGDDAPAGTITYRGSDSTGDLPRISIRDFTGGDAPITTTGTFTLSETMGMHPPATFADGTNTDLVYGDMLANEYIDMGFSNRKGSEGLGLNVYSGDWQAVYQGRGCSWVVQVSPTSVSGHISCTDIPAYNDAAGTTGSIDIELDFTADSTAGAESPASDGG